MHWTPDNLAKLGKVPDGELAQLVGLTREAVTMKRRRAGIAPYQARGRPPKQQAQS